MDNNGGMISHTIGAILAGGSSSRMGRDKSALTIGGVTFLTRLHSTLSGVFEHVVVCGGNMEPEGGLLLPDRDEPVGPLSGMLSAFDEAGDRAVFFIAVDMPLVSASLIRSVVEPAVEVGAARIISVDGRDQPLLGVYGTDVGAIVRARVDQHKNSVHGALDDIAAVERLAAAASAVLNVNTPEDYAAITERLVRSDPSPEL